MTFELARTFAGTAGGRRLVQPHRLGPLDHAAVAFLVASLLDASR